MPISLPAAIILPAILNIILENTPISFAATGHRLPFLSGKETTEDLSKLADDVYLYFGLGCRNVTKLYVPEGYDFIPLLTLLKNMITWPIIINTKTITITIWLFIF